MLTHICLGPAYLTLVVALGNFEYGSWWLLLLSALSKVAEWHLKIKELKNLLHLNIEMHRHAHEIGGLGGWHVC